VEDLMWFNNGEKAKNSIHIEDFCKYKCIVYTELLLSFATLFSSAERKQIKKSGNNLLRSPPLLPMLSLHNPHPTPQLPNAHHTPAPPAILLFSLPSFFTTTTSQHPMAKILLSITSKHRLYLAQLVRPRVHHCMVAHPAITEGIADRQRVVVRKGIFSEAVEVLLEGNVQGVGRCCES